MLLYSTLLCKKIARARGGHKEFMLTKLGGGGGGEGAKQNRSKMTMPRKRQELSLIYPEALRNDDKSSLRFKPDFCELGFFITF